MKPEERIAAELKKISRQEGNRVCADCPERMPSYVNLTHGTFVCTKCSGILRELQYRIKGISMSTFDVEEVRVWPSGGIRSTIPSTWLILMRLETRGRT